MSLLLCATILWLLGLVVGADGSAQVNDFPTCTTGVGGRCEIAEGGCQPDESSNECVIPDRIEERNRGCTNDCRAPPNFCDQIQPETAATDWPVIITPTVHQYQQFNITASWLNLDGWSFQMMLMTADSLKHCVCGQTSPLRSDNLTGFYNDGGLNKTLHICLRNTSGSVRYLRREVYTGSNCLSFARHYHLDASRCRMSRDIIGLVQDLTVLPLWQSTLRVSWTPPLILQGEEEVYNIVYYVTVGGVPSGGSSLETHKFTVSNSTNITVYSLLPGSNYSISVRTWVQCASGSCQHYNPVEVTMPTIAPPTVSTTEKITSTATPTVSTSEWTDYTTADVVQSGHSSVTALALILVSVLLVLILSLPSTIIVYCLVRSWRTSRYKGSENAVSTYPLPSGGISNSESLDTNSTPHLDTHSLTPSQFDLEKLSSDTEVQYTTEYPLTSVSSSALRHILVIGSLRIKTEEHIHSIAYPLLSNLDQERAKIHMYNVDVVDQDRPVEQRQRLGPSQWAGQALEWADTVLCICNREFAEDWNYDGTEMCYEASLVRRVEHFVSGRLNHGQNGKVTQKFIVLVSQREDLQYIPGELEKCSYFVLDSVAEFERLALFLMGMAEVELQISSKSVEHFSPA